MAPSEAFRCLTRHDTYYIDGGDLRLLVENVEFRVHRYFFERSRQFMRVLGTPASPGQKPQSTQESNVIVLDKVTPEQFATFLWVFYNPKYSLYDAKISDWEIILELSVRWEFPEIKDLAIRELEKKEIADSKRIKLYHANNVHPDFLIPRYASLCERDDPLTYEEAEDIGMRTVLMIGAGREAVRAQRLASGGRTSFVRGTELHEVIRKIFKITPETPPSRILQPTAPMTAKKSTAQMGTHPSMIKIQKGKSLTPIPTPAHSILWKDGCDENPIPGSDSDPVHRDTRGRQEGDASASISANISDGTAIIGDSKLERSKPKAFGTTAQYITAQRALAHISVFELPLRMAFSDIRFEGDYKVQVGFNESMLQMDVLVEEIYLYLGGTLQVPEDEVRAAFAPVFSPFPGTIHTQDKTYYLPVDPQDQGAHPFLDLSTMSGVVTANSGHSDQGERGKDVGSGRDRNNGGGNRRKNQENTKRGVGGGDSGGSGSDDEDDEDDHDDSNNRRSGIPGSARKGKGARRSARTANILFSSSLSFTNAFNHQVDTDAGIHITLDENEGGMFRPPDFTSWEGPWLKVDMTELEVSSKAVHPSAYLLSLAQVQVTAYSPDKVALLSRSPISLPAEGNSAKTTNTKNKLLNIGAILGLNPSGQVGFTMGQTSSTERQVARWGVSSSKTTKASEGKMKVDDRAVGALWHYTHNDRMFGRTKGWTFEIEHRPSALFAFGKVKPRVQVKVDVFWSSGMDSSAHTGFPFHRRRMKEQLPVFANFVHQLAAVIDMNDLKESSWFMPDRSKDNVKIEELSASKGPIHFEPETATAYAHSTEGMISTDLKVSITRAVKGRAQLTPAAITDITSLSIQPPSAPLSIEVPPIAESSSLPTPLPSPLLELRQRPKFDDPTEALRATEYLDVSIPNVGTSKSASSGN